MACGRNNPLWYLVQSTNRYQGKRCKEGKESHFISSGIDSPWLLGLGSDIARHDALYGPESCRCAGAPAHLWSLETKAGCHHDCMVQSERLYPARHLIRE